MTTLAMNKSHSDVVWRVRKVWKNAFNFFISFVSFLSLIFTVCFMLLVSGYHDALSFFFSRHFSFVLFCLLFVNQKRGKFLCAFKCQLIMRMLNAKMEVLINSSLFLLSWSIPPIWVDFSAPFIFSFFIRYRQFII